MRKREIGNMALHFAIAIALTALVMWHREFIIFVTFIYLWLREQAQHRWIVTFVQHDTSAPPGTGLYHLDKSTFFGWMTWHRIWEVFQWTIGSAIAVAVWIFIA
jgi:hypothetical protein